MNKIIINNKIKQLKKREKKELYNYLKTKNFHNFLEPIEEDRTYEIYLNTPDILPKKDKAIELMYVIALLHNKTTTYEDLNINKIKEIYEKYKQEIFKIKDYYYSLQDRFEDNIYLLPAEYLLLRNISNIYKLINKSEELLDKWYVLKQNDFKIRKCLLHQNLNIDNLKQINNELFLTNWDNYKEDLVIYDFINFYKNEYKTIEMTSLFDLYLSKYPLDNTEITLLLSILAIPPKVLFNKTNYENTVNIKYLTIYVEKTFLFISKYYKENQKPNY